MASKKYKTTGSISLFDEQETCQKLSAIGNPLEKICNVVDVELFRETLEASLLNKNKKNTAEAKPYDVIVHPFLYTTIFFFLVVIFSSVLIISDGFLTEQKPE